MHAVKGKYTKRVDKWKGRVSVISVAEELRSWVEVHAYLCVLFCLLLFRRN